MPSRATRAIAVSVSGPGQPGAGLRSVVRLVGRQASRAHPHRPQVGGSACGKL